MFCIVSRQVGRCTWHVCVFIGVPKRKQKKSILCLGHLVGGFVSITKMFQFTRLHKLLYFQVAIIFILFLFFNIFSFLRHFFLSFICIYKYIEEFMKCPSVTLNNRRNNTHLMTTKLYIKRKMWYKHFFSIEFQERFLLIQQ